MKKVPIISLTGGLGNQLFQLAAGLSLFGSSQFSFEWGVGKPRLNSSGTPELNSFTIPKNVTFLRKKRFSWLMSKSTGYVLRMGISPRWYENNKMIRQVIIRLSEIVSFFYFGTRRKTVVCQTLGYSDKINVTNSSFVVGYFQSYLYVQMHNTLELMRGLKVEDPDMVIHQFSKLAEEEHPLIVHIRLGDYKHEPGFGLLHENYYRSMIEQEWSSGRYRKIWIFSDEPEIALSYLSNLDLSIFRTIEAPNNSTALTFELMRLGKGYIISNSTFSWWAALLAHNDSVKVVAPEPWFRHIQEPNQLIPPNWVRVPAQWKENNV
jgi:hypothetical protein